MRYLPDTSILVRLYDFDNPIHEVVRTSLEKLLKNDEKLVIVPQILVEFWAVATRPSYANGLGMSTENAEHQLDNLLNLFTLLPDVTGLFDKWKALVIKNKVSGKPTHDARIVAAMVVHGIENILTLNPGDFKRFKEINAIGPNDI